MFDYEKGHHYRSGPTFPWKGHMYGPAEPKSNGGPIKPVFDYGKVIPFQVDTTKIL